MYRFAILVTFDVSTLFFFAVCTGSLYTIYHVFNLHMNEGVIEGGVHPYSMAEDAAMPQ